MKILPLNIESTNFIQKSKFIYTYYIYKINCTYNNKIGYKKRKMTRKYLRIIGDNVNWEYV